MESKKLYESLRSMPKTKRPINTIAVEAGCHLNTVRNVLKLGKASPLYGPVIIAEALRIWEAWQDEQRESVVKIMEAGKRQQKAAAAALKRLAA